MTESDCQHIDLLISGWRERYPIMWKSEPEFGLCRYREIVNEELNRIDDLINCQGVGKGGEKYVRLILPPPSVRLVNKNYPSESRPCKKPSMEAKIFRRHKSPNSDPIAIIDRILASQSLKICVKLV